MQAPAAIWPQTPTARAILAGLTAADVRSAKALGIRGALFDECELIGATDAARAAFDRLDTLRNNAVSAALGYTFKDAQRPYDEAKAGLWLDTAAAVPSVSDAVQAELDGRIAERVAA